jgi:hypothetical protein
MEDIEFLKTMLAEMMMEEIMTRVNHETQSPEDPPRDDCLPQSDGGRCRED